MTPRSSENIAIKRKSNGVDTVVETVLITEKSVRKFMLMQDDYITLDFSLDHATHFAIGDHVDDTNNFGSFCIIEEQMPKFNNTTGGYDYSLKLEKDYMQGKQWIHCLIANNQKMESRWSLTDKLAVHAQQVADNYNISSQPSVTSYSTSNPETGTTTTSYRSTGYGISVTATNASEVKFLSYEGKNLIEAMQMIADAWECEWWITDDSITVGNTTYAHTIHFGKCEGGDPYDFVLGDNVETMDISRDQQDYANRLYVYGGTQNVPESYDRSLVLTATNVYGNSGNKSFIDTSRKLTPEMVVGTETIYSSAFESKTSPIESISSSNQAISSKSKSLFAERYTMSGTLSATLTWQKVEGVSYSPKVSAKAYVVVGEAEKEVASASNIAAAETIDGVKSWTFTTSNANGWILSDDPLALTTLILEESASVSLKVVWTVSLYPLSGALTTEMTAFPTITGTSKTASKSIKVKVGSTEYDAVYNPSHHYGDDVASRIQFSGTMSSFSAGTKVTIPESNWSVLDVPYSFLTKDYTVGTLGVVGERRLHLPLKQSGDNPYYPYRYMELVPQTDMGKVVEKVVIFDNIFPKMMLKVASVETETKTEEITHDDGSIERRNWEQYKFTVTNDDDTDFTFNTKYIMDGNRLKAAFTTPQQPTSDCMLSGMTFEVGFDNLTQVFTLIRNEDYGAKLPDLYIKPSVGDTLFLTGWNPKAIALLDLVGDAEQELATKGLSYLQAIHDGQFTFTCRMMSSWPFDLCSQPFMSNNAVGDTILGNDLPFYVNNEVNDQDPANDMRFRVSNGFTEYALLKEGAKVNVWHDALPEVDGEHYKTSRIIGYEFKLDMPFDTPTYTVGETDAFSRLKKIEKELTKL